jgi:(1->4)-alpha-D-glucan 1-alpha-D-glucosylmutase
MREKDRDAVVALSPVRARTLLGQAGLPQVPPAAWGDTAVQLPEDWRAVTWRNVFTGEQFTASEGLQLGEILRNFPVALLVATRD